MDNRMFRIVREYLGMTQVEFARHINVNENTVYKIDSGRGRVTSNVASKVAKVVEVDEEFEKYLHSRNVFDSGLQVPEAKTKEETEKEEKQQVEQVKKPQQGIKTDMKPEFY